MNRIAVVALLALPTFASQELVAQTFKCRDAAGRVTYSGKACADIGLKADGEVPDRLNVSPAYRAPERPAVAPPKPAAKAPESSDASKTADAAKATPERRCFAVKTATGTVTRCNDVPPEDTAKK